MSGINLKSKAFLESLRLFEDEKKVDPQFVLEILEEAIIKTYQKHLDAPEARVRVDMNGSAMHVYHQLEVVDDECETFDDTLDILLEEALRRLVAIAQSPTGAHGCGPLGCRPRLLRLDSGQSVQQHLYIHSYGQGAARPAYAYRGVQPYPPPPATVHRNQP